jgi:LysR family transcriptional regulator, nitrogen assimilation regulatory protein
VELSQLSAFLCVVDEGGFTRAAAQLGITQSALSRQVALLEADLGQRLLTRTGRGAVPTEAGLALQGHARSLLEQAHRAREELRGLEASPRGRVTVGLPPRVAHALAAPLVQSFRARFPDAVLAVTEGLSVALRERLIAGRIDLAVLFDPPAAPQLEYRMLCREPLVLVASAVTRALPKRVNLEALAAYPMVLPSSGNALRTLVDDAARRAGVTLQVVAEVDSVHTVLSLVRGGVGSTVMPASGVRGYADASGAAPLRMAVIGPPAIRNTMVLAAPRERPQTRLARETAALIAQLDFVALNAVRPAARRATSRD